MVKNAWMIRPFPHDADRLSEFKAHNIIAIGWPQIPSLGGKDIDEIRGILQDHPARYSPRQLGVALSTINIFVNEMAVNDLVVIPYYDNVYFAKVTSDYYFEPAKIDDGYPHQRKIEWLKGPVSREELSDDLRNSLRAPRTATDLKQHYDTIRALIENGYSQPSLSSSSLMDVSYPLRPDLNCTIKIPRDITQDEAERLAEFVKTLYFNP